MGKFERKMKNAAKQNIKSFEEWQEENAVELDEFVKPIKEVKPRNWAKIGRIITASATSLVVVIGATIFAINATKPEIPTVNNSTSDEILEFAGNEIYETDIIINTPLPRHRTFCGRSYKVYGRNGL